MRMKTRSRQRIERFGLAAAGAGLVLFGNPSAWSEEPDEKAALQAEVEGDQAFLIEWLGQPDDDSRLDEMHQEPEIQAIADRMPRAQAKLREWEAKPGSTATETNPED